MDKGKIIRLTLMTLFAAVFCYSAVKLIGIWTTYSENEKIYDDAAEQFLIYTTPAGSGEEPSPPDTTAAPPQTETDESGGTAPSGTVSGPDTAAAPPETSAPPPQTTAPPPAAPDFTPNWAALREVNPDIGGWIWQSGTTINYPLLKGEDNEEYLRTTYNHKSSKLGSIFLDYRSELGGRNAVIYGHNAGNGKMFATLVKYKSRAYYDANPYFYIMTEAGTKKYQIFAAYQVTTDSDTYTFAFEDDAAYEAYLSKILMRSAYNTGVTVGAGDEIVTLSTCTNTGKQIRFVVHAKRIEG